MYTLPLKDGIFLPRLTFLPWNLTFQHEFIQGGKEYTKGISMLRWLSQKYKLTLFQISGKVPFGNCWMQRFERLRCAPAAPAARQGSGLCCCSCRLPAERAKGAQTKTISQLSPSTLHIHSTKRRKKCFLMPFREHRIFSPTIESRYSSVT